MRVRKETAVDMLGSARKLLGGWERRLKNPPDIVLSTDGTGRPVEYGEIEEGAMVVATLGEEDTMKFRAELVAVASMLEGLAGT